MKLPVMDGWTVLDHLKHHPADAPHPRPHRRRRRRRAGEALRAGRRGGASRSLSTRSPSTQPSTTSSSSSHATSSTSSSSRTTRTQRAVAGASSIGDGDDVEVTAVGPSEEALEALAEKRFDCIVLDLKLPDGDRLRAAREAEGERAVRRPAGDRLHRQGADAARGDEAPALRRGDRRQGRPLARAAARRDRALPPPGGATGCRRTSGACSSSSTTADAVSPGQEGPDRRRRRAERLRAHERPRGATAWRSSSRRTAREGLEKLEASPDVDLVLMDIMMPEMDGYETMRQIRAR